MRQLRALFWDPLALICATLFLIAAFSLWPKAPVGNLKALMSLPLVSLLCVGNFIWSLFSMARYRVFLKRAVQGTATECYLLINIILTLILGLAMNMSYYLSDIRGLCLCLTIVQGLLAYAFTQRYISRKNPRP